MDSLEMWGFYEGAHWLPDAALYRKNWEIKPSGKAYLDLVLGDWWTKTQGQSDARGKYRTSGFLGDYEITVSLGDKTRKLAQKLEKNAAPLQVVLG